MSTPIANYEEARRAFELLYQSDCKLRILLINGSAGKGKTTLLNHCREHIPANVRHLPVELRGEAVGIAEIFSRSGIYLDWEQLPRFTRKLSELEGYPKAEIEGNWLFGFKNRIVNVLNVEDSASREYRRVGLTDAWFDDVDALASPFLVLFDAYNKATDDVRDWIGGPFLARAALTSHLRVIVAGQIVPDKNNIEWGDCCREVTLTGVSEPRHWIPVVRQMGRRIPAPDEETWLSGLCHGLHGDPLTIMQELERLPLAASTA